MLQKFYKTQLEKEILIAKLQRHPSLYMVFKKKKYITQYVKSDIKIRIAGEIENFVTIFITGQQGCHLRGTKITTKEGIKNIEEIKSGELVWAENSWRRCDPIIKGRQKIMKITLQNNQELFMTPDHTMKTNRGWLQAKELNKGDNFILGNLNWIPEWNEESKKASLVAMLMADGHLDELNSIHKYSYQRISNRKMTKQPKKGHSFIKKRIRFYNSDTSIRDYFQNTLQELRLITKKRCEYQDKNSQNTKVVCIQNSKLFDYFKNLGVQTGKKAHALTIPEWITKSDATMNGFLAGYFACDGSFYKNTIEISSCSKELINQLMAWLQSRGAICKIGIRERNKKNQNNLYRLFIRNTKSLNLWQDRIPNISKRKKVYLINLQNKKTIRNSAQNQLSITKIENAGKGDVFDLQVDEIHQYLAHGLVSHNSMKSSLAIEIAVENDPTFCVNRICQTYQEFKEKLEKSQPKEWFILDEQVFMHGIGSGRIIDSIQTLIETLRQRQNSMIIISPEKKYFPEDLFTYTLETIDKSLIGECPNEKEPHDIRTCEYRPHTKIDAVVRTAVKKDKEYIGFYVQEIHWETKIWKEYYQKKIAFNQTILKEDFQKIDYKQIAINIANNPKSIPYKTSRQIMLFLEKNYPNFSVGEKGLLIEEIKIRRKMNQQPNINEATQ